MFIAVGGVRPRMSDAESSTAESTPEPVRIVY
jgi:hypothetical protein